MQGAEDPALANPLVTAILTGSAPRPLKISAARGVLPLMRGELVRILVVLLRDGDEQVRTEAASRLSSFPEAEILPLLEDPASPPEVLDHFGCGAGTTSIRTAVIANPATPVSTLRHMAPALIPDQIDQLLMNQTRLIAAPELLDLLESNPALTPLQRSRVVEIRLHFLAGPAPSPREDVAPVPAMAPAPGTVPPAAVEQPETTDDGAPHVISNATMRILRMDTAAKVQLAIKGSREDRSILIKDASKTVQEAVMESPKLSENEVEGFARMRSITEDVLRIIAGNRDWVKNYTIIQALATNPKTPPGIAMTMVSRLTNRDLKILAGDKNVSEVIRRHARKISEGRSQRPGPH